MFEFSALKRWLAPPALADDAQTFAARILHVILLTLLSAGLLAFGFTVVMGMPVAATIILPTSSGVALIAFGLNRRGHTDLASVVLFIDLLALVTYALYRADGLQDIAMLIYPAVIIVASLLFQRRAFFIAIGLIGLSLAFILYGQLSGLVHVLGPKTPLSLWADFGLAVIILGMTAAAVYLLANTLRANLQRAWRNERALAESFERYRLISSVVSDYLFSSTIGPDGGSQLEWVSGAFESITGFAAADDYIASGGWLAHLHPDDAAQDAQDMAVLHGNQRVITEVRTFHKDGSLRWVRVYAQPRWDDKANRLMGIYGAVQNITERKHAEQALRESESRFRAFVDVINDGIIFFTADGGVIEWNKASERITGLSKQQVLHRQVWEIQEQLNTEESKKNWNAEVIKENIHQALEKGYLSEQAHRVSEGNIQHLDGSIRTVERRVFLIHTEHGHTLGVVFHDITERKQAGERDQRRREMLEKVVELGKTVTRPATLDGCLRTIHQSIQQGLGYDRVGLVLYESLTGTLQGAYGTDQQGQIEDTRSFVQRISEHPTWQTVLADPKGFVWVDNYGALHDLPPGSEMATVKQHVTVAAWAGEKPVAVISADNAITQRLITEEQVEALRLFAGYAGLAIENAHLNAELEARVQKRTAELEAANKELESFSYSVSHDLRAPLRGIKGFAQILNEDFGEELSEGGQSYLRRIMGASQRMSQLIDDLLAFSRLGRQPIHKQWVAPRNVVRQVLDDLHAEHENRAVEFIIADLPQCQADPSLLRQIFSNLLGNALKYSRAASPAVIEIGWRPQEGQTAYFVKDNGVGFDMKYAHKLFGVFQRLHRADEFEGTGVGLATVQRIVHRHGGRIWAEADLGKGATFYFTLG